MFPGTESSPAIVMFQQGIKCKDQRSFNHGFFQNWFEVNFDSVYHIEEISFDFVTSVLSYSRHQNVRHVDVLLTGTVIDRR